MWCIETKCPHCGDECDFDHDSEIEVGKSEHTFECLECNEGGLDLIVTSCKPGY